MFRHTMLYMDTGKPHLLLLYDVRRHKVHVKEVASLHRGECVCTAYHGNVYWHRGPLHLTVILRQSMTKGLE